MNLDSPHMKSGEFVVYGYHTSGAAPLLDRLESANKARPFVMCEVFSILAYAGRQSSCARRHCAWYYRGCMPQSAAFIQKFDISKEDITVGRGAAIVILR
jgi:hypothetical protein